MIIRRTAVVDTVSIGMTAAANGYFQTTRRNKRRSLAGLGRIGRSSITCGADATCKSLAQCCLLGRIVEKAGATVGIADMIRACAGAIPVAARRLGRTTRVLVHGTCVARGPQALCCALGRVVEKM